MKKKTIYILFILSIVTNILSFTKMNNNYIYVLKFLFPSLQLFTTLLFYSKELKINRKSINYFSMLMVAFISGIIFTENIIDSILEYFSLIFLLFNTLCVIPSLVQTNPERENILRIIYDIYFYTLLVIVIASIFIFKDTYYIAIPSNRKRYVFYFRNPNSIAAFSFYGIILGLITFKNKIVNIIKILFLFIIIYLSDSRTALYTTLISIISYLLINRFKDKDKYEEFKKNMKLLLLIFFPMMLISIIYIMLKLDYDKIDILLSGRLNEIKKSFSNVKGLKYLFGYGFGQMPNNPHNAFLSVYLETGIIGFIATYYLVYRAFTYKTITNYSNHYPLLLYKNGLILFIIYGLFESVIISQGNFNTFIIWIIIGFLINKTKEQSEEMVNKYE